jgi:protein-disulfide isomerase
MSASEKVQNLLMVVSVTCAVIVTGLVLRRELLPSAGAPVNRDPVPVDNWEELKASGHRRGPTNAAVTVVVFNDFECPACRGFATGPLQNILHDYGDQVAFLFRHWPLSYHRFAYVAARASECAAAQGRFHALHDVFFEQQDSLGLKSFTQFAIEAGVENIIEFERCNSSTEPLAVVAIDSAAVTAAGGTGTPTIIVNGLRVATSQVEEVIRKELGLSSRPL